MRNDVHAPPLEADFDKAAKPQGSPRAPHLDRAHELDAKADHRSAGTNLIYAEPEDRGDSFNTTLSTLVVLIGLAIVGAIAWTMWR